MNGVLRLRLAGLALSALIAFAFAPSATAQWAPPPWPVASPGEIERTLEAQGYGLVAPLVRRPRVYLADVIAGPTGYQRLVIDARNGQILERFLGPAHTWGPALAARDEGFGEPLRGGVGSSWGPGFSDAPAAYGGPGNVHIPAAVGPYGGGRRRGERNSSGSPFRPNARRRRPRGRPRTRLCRRPLHAKCPSRRRSMNPVRPRLATSRRLRPLRR
jgi:hypothetical protein